MNRAKQVSQLIALGSAASIGWICAKIHSKDISSNKLPSFPALPIYGTVSAATGVGSLTPHQTSEIIVPEPAPNAPRIAQIMRFGFPSLSNIRSLDDYVLSYDTRNRVPYWVFEHITAESVAKNDTVSRANSEFHEDASVHEFFRSQNSDYKHSGFDRGHMAAAGNHKKNQKQCDETFLLSNMSPQVGKGFNRDKWNELESYCRKLTKDFKNVYICTGPLYLPRREDDGKLYVKYQVLGQNHVAVPTHFYKIVVCEGYSGQLELESFLLPNQSIDNGIALPTFHVTPEIIERASGLLFFNNVNKSRLSKINGKSVKWF